MLDVLVLVSTVAFILAGAIVGVRLLLLAARTRELTDWIIGFALFDLSAVTYPLILYATLADLPIEATRHAYAMFMVPMAIGFGSVFIFTQRVFRPGEAWASALAASGLVALAYGLIAGVQYVLAAPDRAALTSRISPSIWIELGAVVAYVWTAIEGFRCWEQAHRRLQLGLADPLVVNRFFLWGLIGVSSLLSVAPSLVISLAGGDGTRSVAARLTTAVGGVVTSVALQLAFLPPARYRAWIARSHAAA
jgi:hypothetical protein